MDRREYLATIGSIGAALLAGCPGDDPSTPTPTPVETPSPTSTEAGAQPAVATDTPSPTSASTEPSTSTPAETSTPTSTATDSPTSTPTESPTPTPTETATPSPTPSPSPTPDPTPTSTPEIDESKVYVSSSEMLVDREDDILHVNGSVQNDNNRPVEASFAATLLDENGDTIVQIQTDYEVIGGGGYYEFRAEGDQYADEAHDHDPVVYVK